MRPWRMGTSDAMVYYNISSDSVSDNAASWAGDVRCAAPHHGARAEGWVGDAFGGRRLWPALATPSEHIA